MAGDGQSSSVRRAKARGEEQPFLEALAARYRGALNRFFNRRAPHLGSEVEDLTQEVFVRLARRRDGESIRHVEGYIFQTALSVLTDRARRRSVRLADMHVAYDESENAVEDFSPERVLLAREQVEMVKTVLAGLPDKVRAAFVLHRFEELGYWEIARRLGVSASSVEKYISQALRALTEARTRDEL